MFLESLLDRLGDAPVAALFGLLTGVVFGVAAQRSSFSLRVTTVEFARGRLGPKVAVWLLTFSTALVWVQAARMLGLFDPDTARMMAVAGSWSGAVIDGLLFGVGMAPARGCSGRLLVLAATGTALGGLRADLRRGRADEPARLAGAAVGDAGRAQC